MFEMKPTDHLIQIAAASGGMELRGAMKPTEDLVRLASATARGGGYFYLRQMGMRPLEDLLRIAAAGSGHVIFADPLPDND